MKTAANLFTAPPRLLQAILNWAQPIFENPPAKNVQRTFQVDLKGWTYYDRVKDRVTALEAKRYARELSLYNQDLETHKKVTEQAQKLRQESLNALAPYLKDWSPSNPIKKSKEFQRDAKKWGWDNTSVRQPLSDGWVLKYPALLTYTQPPTLEPPTLFPPQDYLQRNKLDALMMFPWELQSALEAPKPPKNTRTVENYKVTVIVHAIDDQVEPLFQGFWDTSKRQIHIYPTRFNWNWEEAEDLLNHEIVHAGQSILQELLGLKFPAGLPPKRVRSRAYDAQGQKATSSPSNPLPLDPLDPHKRVVHELRDIEFHTRLNDEVRGYKRYFLPHHQTGLTGFDYVDWVQRSPFFQTLLKHDFPRYNYAVKTFRNTVNPQVKLAKVQSMDKVWVAKLQGYWNTTLEKPLNTLLEGQGTVKDWLKWIDSLKSFVSSLHVDLFYRKGLSMKESPLNPLGEMKGHLDWAMDQANTLERAANRTFAGKPLNLTVPPNTFKEVQDLPKRMDKLLALLSSLVKSRSEVFIKPQPQSIQLGRVTVLPLVEPVLENPLNALPQYALIVKKVLSELQAKGFGYLCYGDVLCGTRTWGQAKASYNPTTDQVFCFRSPKDPDVLRSLIHEFGHRWYYRFMDRNQQAQFDRFFGKVKPTTTYGGSHDYEDFAEVFADWILDAPLSREQVERLQAVLNPADPHAQVTPILPPAKVAAKGKYNHINFKPPESVANAAARGLKLRQKASPSNRGGLTS